MPRKKKKEEKPRLSPERYWEWRTTIEELKSAQLNLQRVNLEKDNKSLIIQTKKLEMALFGKTVEKAKSEVEAAKAEYDRFKALIEDETGTDLNNKIIDDVTFEIRKIDNP